MKGFKKGVGGVNPLNFNVVDGTTEPSNPRANTIWVNTGTKMTGWVFSATEPTKPTYGMVWFAVGAASPVPFNVLKKNDIQVYPRSAKQYISGAWDEKPAKIFQNGKWNDWVTYLYKSGDECISLTGGWTATNYRRSGYHVATLIATTKGEGSITVSLSGMFWDDYEDVNKHCSGTLFSEKAIDFSGLDTLAINITDFSSGAGERDIVFFGVSSSKTDNFNKLAETTANAVGRFELDVSDIDTTAFVYVALDYPDSTTSVTFDEISAE